ncbi:MAG: hypothetical protein FJW35_07775 [Acidobacteria bacterium]|nr:hypothetical protein [Acidobacteriota bacterium]
MPLIPVEPVPPKKEQLNLRLNPDLLALLESYCEFISSTQNYVIEQAILHVFRRDRDFREWLRTHGPTGKGEKVKKGKKGKKGKRVIADDSVSADPEV